MPKMSQDGAGDKSSKETKETEATTPKPASSAAAAPARRFMPNVGVERAKREIQNDPDLVDKAAKPARRPAQPNLGGARGRGGGRGGRHEPNLIQSHSVFEAGPAESTRRYESRNAADTSANQVLGSVSGSSSMGGRGGKNEPLSMTDPKLEERLIIDDSVADDDPVYIKFNYDNKENELVSRFKREKEATTTTTTTGDDLKPEKISDKEVLVLNELFRAPTQEAADEAASEAGESQSDGSLLLLQISEALQLHDIPQSGHIGKLRVHKSGRIELCINDNITFDVALSASGPFYQEAFLFQPGDETTQAELKNLGEVKNKLVCLPQI